MKLLVIYTHPNHQSLSYVFLQKVIDGSRENPSVEDVKVLNLYEEQFDPRLLFNKTKRRRDMHRDPELEKYRQLLIWADKLIFVYPIWWGRPPAMLMGFIDRMFASNFAYQDTGGLLPKGMLQGRSVVCVSTMKGPTYYLQYWLYNAHRILMRKALFQYVGIKQVKFFEFGNMESEKGKHERKLAKIYRYFKTIQA